MIGVQKEGPSDEAQLCLGITHEDSSLGYCGPKSQKGIKKHRTVDTILKLTKSQMSNAHL